MTLVRRDTLEVWKGEAIPYKTKSAQLHLLDGTVHDVEVQEYTFEVRHPQNIGDVWTDEELWSKGLARPRKFELPEGKVIAGDVIYELGDGFIQEVYPIKDAPPPPPPPAPEPELKPEEKLRKSGLTIDELKALLKD